MTPNTPNPTSSQRAPRYDQWSGIGHVFARASRVANHGISAGRIAQALLFVLLTAVPAIAQETGTLAPVAKQQFFKNNGDVCVACKLYTYSAGTTTPQTTYTDSALAVANANPIILDAGGRATIFLSATSYKFVLKDASDATIWTQDTIESIGALSLRPYDPAITPTTLATNTDNWNPSGLSTAKTLRVVLSANVDLTGIASQPVGTSIVLWNMGPGFTLTLKHSSGSSSAGNKFNLKNFADVVLQASDGVLLYYDSTGFWFVR